MFEYVFFFGGRPGCYTLLSWTSDADQKDPCLKNSCGKSKRMEKTAKSSTSQRYPNTHKPSTSFDGLPRVSKDSYTFPFSSLPKYSSHKQDQSLTPLDCTGETLASAGDDGNVILWVPSESSNPAFGSDGFDDKETWRTKHMCRSSGSEIYDLAWSPDGAYFIIGSMDNVARIYNAASGKDNTRNLPTTGTQEH